MPARARNDRIVITHGTDSMEETAAVLGQGVDGKDKTIVLTGAMVPYTFGSSDGMFNLGTALAFVQTLATGRVCGDERSVLYLARGTEEPEARDLRSSGLDRHMRPGHEGTLSGFLSRRIR